jgi:Rho GDP-dissociation inhibitor
MSEAPPVKPPKPSRQGASEVSTEPGVATEPAAGVGASEGASADTGLEGSVADITLKGSKNVSDIMALDNEDESLRKYKESLLGSAAKGDLGDVSDPRKLIVEEFRVVFAPEENREDIVHSLSTPEGLANLASTGITMKEGSKFKFRISFRVQHEIIAGIKFVNVVKAMVASEKEELVIGSYPPSSEPHKFEFPKWEYSEAPKGMLMRGKYKVSNKFVDSDKVKHLEFEYELNIVK